MTNDTSFIANLLNRRDRRNSVRADQSGCRIVVRGYGTDIASARSCDSRNETSDRKDKAIHPSGQEDGRIPSPYEASHTHYRGLTCTRDPRTYTTPGSNLEACGCVYAERSRDLSRERKETDELGVRSGSQLKPAHRARTIVGPKMGLTIVQSAGNAPRCTSIARVHACVLRACLGWPNFGHLPAVIRLRKKELIVELGNSYVVGYFDGDSERFNYLGAFRLLRVDVVKFICSWPAAWVLKFAR